MKIYYGFLYLLFLLTFLTCSKSLDPDSVAGSITARIFSLGILVTIYEVHSNYLKIFHERCTTVKFDRNGLTSDLKENVFGQHLVKDTVIQAVQEHMKRPKPTKALLMSFHGCTGCGKNYISTLIAKSLFKNGMNSNYVHLYFEMNQPEHIEQYKKKLKKDIKKATSYCQNNLFIFDEVDKMAPGVLDALYPFVTEKSWNEERDYRKNIFIFLSNAGASAINKVTFKLLSEGNNRESIKLTDVEPLITEEGHNDIGGLQDSAIVHNKLIDYYVPFLPLERKHVKQCVEAELNNREKRFSSEMVEKIVNQLEYAPKGAEAFAVSGCKKVSAKVDLFA